MEIYIRFLARYFFPKMTGNYRQFYLVFSKEAIFNGKTHLYSLMVKKWLKSELKMDKIIQ